MEYIQGKCYTSLDDYDMVIEQFAAVPRVGDYVAVLYKGIRKQLKVIRIIHSMKPGETAITPYILVELHN